MNIGEKILKKIKAEKIKPISKWEFLLKEYFFWGAFGLSVLVGGLALSVVLHNTLSNDWDLFVELSGGLFKFIIYTLPYFWIIILMLFAGLAYFNLKLTKKAYKFDLKIIIGGLILASVFLGITFYNLGLGFWIDEGTFHHFPKYHKITDHRGVLWQKPDGGFLIGMIISTDKDNDFKLKDLKGNIWMVNLNEEMRERLFENLKEGMRVRLVGKVKTEDCEMEKCFEAKMLRHFERKF